MADFTPTQGRYLGYIHVYTQLHGRPPSEAEMVQSMGVTAPSVHNMVKMLESKGLIQRQPGVPRSIKILVPAEEIPAWSKVPTVPTAPKPQPSRATSKAAQVMAQAMTSTDKLYTLAVYLSDYGGGRKWDGQEIRRDIEIRGDQTLDDLHWAIFAAFDRDDEHLYEFVLGKTPRDHTAVRYGMMVDTGGDDEEASETFMSDLGLNLKRAFWYMFDFGDSWWHRIEVLKIATPEPKKRYPRITERQGKSPPQYPDGDDEE